MKIRDSKFVRIGGNPTGIVGLLLTNIWNVAFKKMSIWGLGFVAINQDDTILDIGCGGGSAIHMISKEISSGKVYGVDSSKEALKTATRINQEDIRNKRVMLCQASVESLGFEKEMFDLVTAIQTHCYWDNLEVGLKEVYRVLKYGGNFLLVCEKDKIAYHMHQYSKNHEMLQLIDDIGYQSSSIRERGNWIAFCITK